MLDDLRQDKGTVWNIGELCQRFGLTVPRAKSSPRGQEAEVDLDRFIYTGYLRKGKPFLEAIRGKFSCVYHDAERKQLFFARDWIGETPMHWAVARDGFVVANTITALKERLAGRYHYAYVHAFPQAKWLKADLSHVDPHCVAETCRFPADELYYDFAAACVRKSDPNLNRRALQPRMELVRHHLEDAVRLRVGGGPRSGPVAVLLSGGLDSFSVALLLRALDMPVVGYTLAIDEGGDDVTMASEFARYLKIEHRIVRVTGQDVLDVADQVVSIAETYHLYNYYCAVGMYLLGRQLASDGVTTAFCGEAVNEALGDYHDWVVTDPQTGASKTLQHVNFRRMQQSKERLLYVWGQSWDRGKYNRQLGTGLAKHAGARMVKPFLSHSLNLECPYYDHQILSDLVSLPHEALESVDGKPGLFMLAFREDLERWRVPESAVLACKKVRFQDASEGGRGGITPVLLGAGYDQLRLLEMFNERFQAGLNARQEAERLAVVTG